MTKAATDVLAERRRQVEVEGWSAEHDDATHDTGQMAVAAACYALGRRYVSPKNRFGATIDMWPWPAKWWKPKGKRRNLIRAAALLLAEIERLDRLTALARHKEEG
jgi:hypothetical protein